MYLAAHNISVAGRGAPLIPPTSLAVAEHQVSYVEAHTDSTTALALAVSGRVPLDGGELEYHGDGPVSLEEASAIVDAPGVSAPEETLPVIDVVGEELAVAGRPCGPKAALTWLRHHDMEHLAKVTVRDLDGTTRVHLMCALAVARRGIRLLVLDAPDRHDGPIADITRLAEGYAANGYAVLVICDPRTTALLGVPAYRVGSTADLAGSES